MYALCAQEDAFTASSAERFCFSGASTRILHSLILFSRVERSFLVSCRAAVSWFFFPTRMSCVSRCSSFASLVAIAAASAFASSTLCSTS